MRAAPARAALFVAAGLAVTTTLGFKMAGVPAGTPAPAERGVRPDQGLRPTSVHLLQRPGNLASLRPPPPARPPMASWYFIGERGVAGMGSPGGAAEVSPPLQRWDGELGPGGPAFPGMNAGVTLGRPSGAHGGPQRATPRPSMKHPEPPNAGGGEQPKSRAAVAGRAGRPGTVLLLYTGEQRGHLEPCGCTTPQIGGLPRRATFLAALSPDPAPVVVDDGDMVADPGRQSQLKAEALASFYRIAGCAAVNMGEQDFHLGFGYLRALQTEAKVPFLCANVRLGVRPALSETTTASGITLVGLLAASLGPDVKRWNPMLAFEAPEAALARLEPKLKEAGRVVLLFHGAPEEARPLARRFPWLAAIVTAHEADDYRPEPLVEAGVPMVNAGRWGKVIGRLELGPRGARQLPPATLGPEWADAAPVRALMTRYLSRVNAEGLLNEVPRLPDPAGNAYAGTARCQSCHAAASATWQQSGHAHAYQALVTAGHDRDPDCAGCHVVGMGSQSGFRSLAATPKLINVGCESCHGGGAAHAQAPAAHPLPLVGESACRRCHVAEQSPHFDFAAYWAKVRH